MTPGIAGRAGPKRKPINAASCSTGMAVNLADELAARGGSGCCADDPAPKRGEIALLGLKTSIDQIPTHAFRHRQCKRCDQPSGGEVVVDVGVAAHSKRWACAHVG